jgi:hypothetical protein
MKLLSIILTIVILATSSIVISCSCGGGGSPSDVVKEYYKAANAGDIDKAMEYVNIGNVLAPGEMALSGLDGGIEKIEIVEEDREKVFGSEMASVTVKIYYTPKGSQGHFGRRGDVYNVTLEKHDSGWKIEFINRTRPITGSVDEDTSVTMDIDNQDSSSSQDHEEEVYTILNYPKNPKTPGEVVAAALFISDAVLGGTVSWDKYLELFPKSAREEFEKEIRDLSDLPEPYGWIEVRILKVEVSDDGTRATVTFSAKRNKGEGLSNEEAHCIKENGAWKLEATS